MRGKLITCSLNKLKSLDIPKNSYVFLTTRGKRSIDGIKQLDILAPTPKLFNQYYNNWKGTDSSLWWEQYKEQYNKNLLSDESCLDVLEQITTGVDEGKNVVLLCFCSDKEHCHRKLLADYFTEKGYEVEEY